MTINEMGQIGTVLLRPVGIPPMLAFGQWFIIIIIIIIYYLSLLS